MKALVQRVRQASVTIEEKLYSQIGQGLLVLLGVEKGDTEKEAEWIAKKISALRIFEDDAGKMNLSVRDINGSLLVVSQFTLAGDTSRGNRPGFEHAARPDDAKKLYEFTVQKLREQNIPTETGVFQADMQVMLINDGPVTFMLEKAPAHE